jgi:hypothetical protein
LEGRSRKEVARILGVPEGTLSSRLAYAKKLLGRRLSRFGTVAVTALLAESAASASLSPLLRVSTAKTALAAGAIPAKVLALTEGVIKAMFLNKLKITVCSGTLMLLAGMGASGVTYRATAQQPAQGVARESRSQADELESLRLEIEALRKSLQATRERVKTLEDEVRIMKRAERNPAQKMRDGMMGRPSNSLDDFRPGGRPPAGPARETPSPATLPSGGVPASPTAAPPGVSVSSTRTISPASASPAAAKVYSPQDLIIQVPPSQTPEPASDSLPHAEKALKRLRENPNDKKAVEELERALKQLKEREKQRLPQ